MIGAFGLFILYPSLVLGHTVAIVLLVACVLRWRLRKHWTLGLLSASLGLLLVAIGVQWLESLGFLSYWLGLAAQLCAAVGGVGMVVSTLRAPIKTNH